MLNEVQSSSITGIGKAEKRDDGYMGLLLQLTLLADSLSANAI